MRRWSVNHWSHFTIEKDDRRGNETRRPIGSYISTLSLCVEYLTVGIVPLRLVDGTRVLDEGH